MYPTEKLAEIAAARQTRLAVKANPAVRRKWTKYQIALGKALDCRTHFNDLTNAFKAYRREVIDHCGPFYASHFNITIEMSLSALIRKYRIAQIPINWYGRTWGSSKLRLGQMGRRYLCVLLKLFFERILIADDIIADREAAEKKNLEGPQQEN